MTNQSLKRRKAPARVLACALVAFTAAGLASAGGAGAADTTGTVTAYAPEPGAVLSGEIITWQGELLANKTTAGYTSFSTAGAGAASPIAAGIVRTSIIFNGQLTWIDSLNNVKSSNPGGLVTNLGTVPAGSDSMLAVGTQLWISRVGGVDRYSPAATLGGATSLALTFGATSTMRMTIGPDNNVWVLEKNPAANGVDTISRWNPQTAVQVGSTINFASSAADPSAIAHGSDGAVWIVEGGINAIARFDQNTTASELVLPPGASPQSISAGPDGAVWLTEAGLNNVSRLTFGAGTIKREPYAAPSSFGLKGLTVGPDNNLWAVGTVANRVAKFGTTPPTTTTIATTTLPSTTTAAPTTTTTAPPATIVITTPPTAQAPVVITVKKRVCTKTAKRRVKVNGKYVTRTVCIKYR